MNDKTLVSLEVTFLSFPYFLSFLHSVLVTCNFFISCPQCRTVFHSFHQVPRQKEALLLDQVRTLGTPVFFLKSLIFHLRHSQFKFSVLFPFDRRNPPCEEKPLILTVFTGTCQSAAALLSQCATKENRRGVLSLLLLKNISAISFVLINAKTLEMKLS